MTPHERAKRAVAVATVPIHVVRDLVNDLSARVAQLEEDSVLLDQMETRCTDIGKLYGKYHIVVRVPSGYKYIEVADSKGLRAALRIAFAGGEHE